MGPRPFYVLPVVGMTAEATSGVAVERTGGSWAAWADEAVSCWALWVRGTLAAKAD